MNLADQEAARNRTQRDYPRDRCVHELFELQAKNTPSATAVVFGNSALTYLELNERAEALARHLRELGVAESRLVGIFLERSIEMLVSMLGIMKAGGAYVPLDPGYPHERLRWMIEDAELTLVVTQRSLISSLPSTTLRRLVMEDTPLTHASAAAKVDAPRISSDSLAYTIFTSGSTGRPKGVQVTHRNLANLLCAMQERPGLHRDDRLLAVTTLSFDIAALELLLPLVSGARTIIAKAEDALDGYALQRLLDEHDVTVMQATPVTFRLLEEAGWPGKANLRILCGGEALPSDLAARLIPKTRELWNMYGPTETTVWSSAIKVDDPGVIRLGPPIANTHFHVVSEAGDSVVVGEWGELWIGGDGVTKGYIGRPDLTAERFVDARFLREEDNPVYRTGDRVRWCDGGTLEFGGRLDSQVKIRGSRIELGEIEAALSQLESITQGICVAKQDESGGHLVAYYTTKECGPLGEDELRTCLREKLPEYMVPNRFVHLTRLPLTPNGKIDRKLLIEAEDVSDRQLAQAVAPVTATERMLIEIWQKALKRTPIGTTDNFFDLGGHSLIAVRIFNAITRRTRRYFPLTTLIECPTIWQLARRIDGEDLPQHTWTSLIPLQREGAHPPLFLVHGVGGNILDMQVLAREMPPDQPIYAIQAQGLDGKSERHKTVEEMADHYTKEILEAQAEGPFYLCGESFGGFVVYEMAWRLRQMGHEIGMVGMLDTHAPGYPKFPPKTSVFKRFLLFNATRVQSHTYNLLHSSTSEKLTYVRQKAKRYAKRLRRRFKRKWSQSLIDFEQMALRGPNQQARQSGLAALYTYEAPRYDLRVTLFQATKIPLGSIPDRTNGWANIALGGVDVIEVPGHHGTLAQQPRARYSAQKIIERMHSPRSPVDYSTDGPSIDATVHDGGY